MSRNVVPVPLRRPEVFNDRAKKNFALDRRKRLCEHLGHQPSHVEAILIDRICSMEWQLRILDRRITVEIPIDELKTLLQAAGSLEMRLRMDLQALGMNPKAPIDERLEARLSDFLAGREENVGLARNGPRTDDVEAGRQDVAEVAS